MRKQTDLCGIWDFQFLPKTGDSRPEWNFQSGITYPERQAVPGCFDATAPHAGKRGVGLYRKFVKVSRDCTVQLDFGGLLQTGRIFWDGTEVGTDFFPYSAYSCSFPTNAGTHELVVAAENCFDSAYNPLTLKPSDFYAFGGILRSVTITELPDEARLKRCTVTTLDIATGKVRLDIGIDNLPGSQLVAMMIQFDDGAAITRNIMFQDGTGSGEFFVDNPTPWTPETPNLHTVKLILPGCDDSLIERFGIRTIEAKNAKLLLNGKPIFLKGYNRHESHPEFGAAVPPNIQIEDLYILKDLNCNFIRGCHYPQDQGFLDLCDELGFLVWEESLAWGNTAESLNDPLFIQRQIEQTENMVRVSGNHPCVILWGFMNELHSHLPEGRKLIETLVKTVKKLDTSRPVTFASMMVVWGDISLDLPDVISCNTYPGWYETQPYPENPEEKIKERFDKIVEIVSSEQLKDKPLLISEIGAAALYGCHDRMRFQWSEEYQSDYIAEVCKQIAAHPRFQGVALWQFTDIRSYPGGPTLNRCRSFNNKGSLDEYRREKMVAATVRDIFSKPPFNGK